MKNHQYIEGSRNMQFYSNDGTVIQVEHLVINIILPGSISAKQQKGGKKC